MNKNTSYFISNYLNIFLKRKYLLLILFFIIGISLLLGNLAQQERINIDNNREYEVRMTILADRNFSIFDDIGSKVAINNNNNGMNTFLSNVSENAFSQFSTIKKTIFTKPLEVLVKTVNNTSNIIDYIESEGQFDKDTDKNFFKSVQSVYDPNYRDRDVVWINVTSTDIENAKLNLINYFKFINNRIFEGNLSAYNKALEQIIYEGDILDQVFEIDNNITNQELIDDKEVIEFQRSILVELIKREIQNENFRNIYNPDFKNFYTRDLRPHFSTRVISNAANNPLYLPIVFLIASIFIYFVLIYLFFRKDLQE